MPRVVSVFPSRILQLQTTGSWDFMGLPEPAQENQAPESESNIMVGVFDTGIWPESPSFRDDGLSSPPEKWKGVCQGGQNFTCNNKIIGARAYNLSTSVIEGSARDVNGHGSHTASTAAGRSVTNTSFYGIANGTVRGGAPFARIAVYKVCRGSCPEALILAAFDGAIVDGVDIISISLIGRVTQFDTDSIAIGSYHAMEKGILTVQDAGNEGNTSGLTASVAPWIFSVAASSTERRIIDKVVLGDGTTLIGNNINPFTLTGDKYPLVCDKLSTASAQHDQPSGNLSAVSYEGNIVVTRTGESLGDIMAFGDVGAVTANDRKPDVSYRVPLPAVALGLNEFAAVMSCVVNVSNPQATILKSECVKDTSATVVVSFSSRGPNRIAKDILKPDIAAPGVDILAAYSPLGPLTEFANDKRSVIYSILSGTSMACPHVAGTAAYLKSLHPDWSPSAIASAIMTTAFPMSRTKNTEGEFAYGAEHLNPTKAANPGLVYETTRYDYISLLCNLGYNAAQIVTIVGNESYSCQKQGADQSSPVDVNYPTMSAKVDAGKPFNVNFSRTVTNVGVSNSTYTETVDLDQSIKVTVTVEPNSLSFKTLKEQKSFSVTVFGDGLSSISSVSGSLVWSDGIHSVRSPIVVYSGETR